MAGKAAQTSSEMPAKISFLRPVASIARATRASSKALTVDRSMICIPGSASTSSGNVGPPHAAARRGGDDDRELQQLGGFGEANDVVLQLASGDVANARHEADLVVDEDERCVLGRQRLISTISIRHHFLLSCGLNGFGSDVPEASLLGL